MDPGCPVQVRVALRVRDLVPRERLEGFFSCIHVSDNTTAVLGGERSFVFDYAFGPDSTQASVYERSVKPLIESALSGMNVSVLAYGQTGSGKTHTMGTDGLLGKTPGDFGVVPRIARDLFQACQEMVGISIVVSALEIYGEELRDLLSDDSKARLQIREDRSGQITVVGLQEATVSSSDDLLEVLGRGLLRRTTGSTNMNSASSRSHALCTITLQTSAPPMAGGSTSNYASMSRSAATVYSKIQLVDLAGSERLTQTFSKTVKETCQINRGLHALSNVIMALSSSTSAASPAHVPYRDSKLTRVLQDSLGGSARTLMIACVSAADESVQESLSTLQYATRARRIQNRATTPSPVKPPSGDSIVNLQWTVLRKCLSCAGLIPLPEVLMQDLQGKNDEDTRVALLQAANKCFPASFGNTHFDLDTVPPSHSGRRLQQQLDPSGSAPGTSTPSQAFGAQSRRAQALSESGCSPSFTRGSDSECASGAQATKLDATRTSICSVDAASQTAPDEPAAHCLTLQKRNTPKQPSNVVILEDVRGTPALQGHDIALKYLMQSQDDVREEWGGLLSSTCRPLVCHQGTEHEDLVTQAEESHNGKDIVVFDEEQASYISSTDYASAQCITGHQARVLAEHETASLAAADTQKRLLDTIRELEAEVVFQEGQLQTARDVEARACIERDCAQRACTQLQHQIDLQQQELEDLHKGMRELEASLGRSEAEKAAARKLHEERIHAANARKKALELQLRSQAAAASEGAASAGKIRELSQTLDKLQSSKAHAVQELRACQMEHKEREAKMQARLVALQRQLRGSERRAAMLQQDKSRAATALQRKDQQLQDSKQAVQNLQASLEASEKRSAAANTSTSSDKGVTKHRSQDGSCLSSKIATDTNSNAAQATAWWDEQISLLAQRLSAGKRTEHLQQRLTDVAQQITAAQQLDSSESGAVLEDLKLQQHVLENSLAVARERVASSALIQRNMQQAVATLPPITIRKVLLHLVSSTLSAYTAACSSRAEAHHIHTSLERTIKLNELLTVQVASSTASSAHTLALGAPRSHESMGLSTGSSKSKKLPQLEQSPQNVPVMQETGVAHFSPAAMDCVRPAALRAALSAGNLVHNGCQNASTHANAAPRQPSEAPSDARVLLQNHNMPRVCDQEQSGNRSLPHLQDALSLPLSCETTGYPQSSMAHGDMQLKANRCTLSAAAAVHEHPVQLHDLMGAAAGKPTQEYTNEPRGGNVYHSTVEDCSERCGSPVDGLHIHSRQKTELQSHAITQSAMFQSSAFSDQSSSGSMGTTNRTEHSQIDKNEGSNRRHVAVRVKQPRPRSLTPKRVSFADEQGDCKPRCPNPTGSNLVIPGASEAFERLSNASSSTLERPDTSHVSSRGYSEKGSVVDRSDAGPTQPFASLQVRDRSSGSKQAGTLSGPESSAGSFGAGRALLSSLAADSAGIGDNEWTKKWPENVLCQLRTPGKPIAAAGSALVSGSDTMCAQGGPTQSGYRVQCESPTVRAQQRAVPSPRLSRTPPAKVHAYRKKLEELHAKGALVDN